MREREAVKSELVFTKVVKCIFKYVVITIFNLHSINMENRAQSVLN